jgi:pyruvate,water dikinase
MAPRERFDHLFEVETPPGAEGWQEMYPYYLPPQEETRDHEASLFWLQDKYHHAHPYYPFDTIAFEAWGLGCGQYTTRVFAVPPVFGLDQRLVNGYLYFAAVPVTDPAEIERRAEHFMERAGFYYANWDSLYEKWKSEKAMPTIREMEAISFAPLPDLEDSSMVYEARGRSTGYDALVNYNALIDRFLLMHQFHFEMLNIGYGAYITFFEFCKSAFPDIADQDVARMVAGLEVLAFRPDQELKDLATKAFESGIADQFGDGREPAEVLKALEGSDAGRAWLARYEEAKYPWFNFSSEYGFYHDQRAWVDDLSVPFRGINDYIARLQAGASLERPTERLIEERDELATRYRALLDDDAVRQQFDELLGLSRTVFPYIEDHNFYVEHWSHTVFWNKMRELGALMVHSGLLQNADDLFYLSRYEVSERLFDVVESWAIGVPPRGIQRTRALIEKRKGQLTALREWHAPPALGVPPTVVNDPLTIMNYGITSERLAEWLRGEDEDATTLTGVAASQGVVEGLARVIRSEKELDQVQPGEILVSPTTAPSWASVFSKIGGVVADAGGMMSHAAIVCREYGLPAVVGVGHATVALKTGQLLRVDGRAGTVTILEPVDTSPPVDPEAIGAQA